VKNKAARRLLSDLWDRYGDACWEWPLARKSDGYPIVGWDGRTRHAHRVAYEFLVGPIPDGLTLDHLCRNRGCVNPDHLEPVTHQENCRRARKDYCAHGHELTPENTYIRPSNGRRACRECGRIATRAYNSRQRTDAT
jgi:hypothetical protein